MAKVIVDTEELYDTNEAASLLEIGYATLYRWIKVGKIIAVKFSGRTLIPRSEIERVKNNKNKQATEITSVA